MWTDALPSEPPGKSYYTVEVTDRLKRLNLIDRVPEEIWIEILDTLQEAVIKKIPKKKKCKKAKWLPEEVVGWHYQCDGHDFE